MNNWSKFVIGAVVAGLVSSQAVVADTTADTGTDKKAEGQSGTTKKKGTTTKADGASTAGENACKGGCKGGCNAAKKDATKGN